MAKKSKKKTSKAQRKYEFFQTRRGFYLLVFVAVFFFIMTIAMFANTTPDTAVLGVSGY